MVDGEGWIDTNGDGDAGAGEFVDYQLLVKNIGTVTLTSIVLEDGAVNSDRITWKPSVPDSLVPGQIFECHAKYTVRQPPVCCYDL